MASYGTKFRFRWQAANGADYEIDIKEKGYSGTVYDRAMGAAPQLKRENNGHIYGTSLDIYAECKVDGEFSSLYTSDPTMYQVELYQGSVLMWIGFVSPELYSEPDIAPPYDVTIVATDGLGELKRTEWGPASTLRTIHEHLTYLLNLTGLSLSIDLVSSMHTSTTTWRTLFTGCWVDLADREGDTCYDVLEDLLASLNMRITEQAGRWLLLRETDAVHKASSGPSRLECYSLTSGAEIYDHHLVSVGSAGQGYKHFPVGQLSSEVTPGSKAVTVKAPNYFKDSALTNSDITQDTAWTKVSQATFQEVGGDYDHAFYLLNGFSSYDKDYNDDTLDGYSRGIIKQAIQLNTMTRAMRLLLDLGSNEQMYSDGLRVRVKVTYVGITSGDTYYLQQYTDNDGKARTAWRDYNSSVYAYVDSANSRQSTDIIIPPIGEPSVLTVQVEGAVQRASGTSQSQYSTRVFGVYLTYASELVGQQLKVVLDNNARDEMTEVETVLSTWDSTKTSDDAAKSFCNGLVLYGGSKPVYDWQSDKLGAQDYLGFITMDLALANALPRLVKTGKLFIGQDYSRVPLLVRSASIDYIVDTYTYDLYESEFDFKMTSLPATALTVSSEERTAIPTEAGSGASSGSGSSSSGGSSAGGTVTFVGLTMPDGFTTDGSPVTTSGTINVALDSDRVLPTTTQKSNWDNAYSDSHSHSNKTILDALTATKAGQWDEAYNQKHTHDNKDVIDGISADQVTLWDKVASGKVIKSSVVEYGVSYSGTEKPTYWMSYVPSISLGMYLWTRVTTTYTDGTTLIAYSVSRQGKNGAGIASETIEYGISTSASVKPTSWSESVPTSFSQGDYLWTRTTLTFDDGTSSVSYSVSYIGTDGSGISGIVVEYASGASGVSAPTSGWSTSVPSVDQGKYLWTRMTISYTDGRANKISYSVSYQGTDGSSEPGLPGCIYRQTKWEPGKVYRNDQVGGTTAPDGLRYIDICTDVAIALLSDSFNMYICQQTHTSDSTTNTLGKSGLWTKVTSTAPMATSLLLAKQIIADYIDTNSLTADEAFIEQLNSKNLKSREITTENISGFLHMAGNVLQMFNSSGNERLRVHGGTLTDLTTSTYKDPTSTTTASGTKTFTNTSTKSYTTTRTIRTRTISSAMVLTLPEQSVTISATGSIDGDRKDTYDAQICVEWLVDGVVKSSVYGALSVDYSSQSASALLTLPAAVVNVDSGSHTVVIRTSIDYTGGIEITSGDAMTVSSSTQVSASSVVWATSVQKTEIANNGFRVALSSTVYFTVNLTNSVSTIQMMNGSYGLKLTSSGLFKTTNGGSTWTSL